MLITCIKGHSDNNRQRQFPDQVTDEKPRSPSSFNLATGWWVSAGFAFHPDMKIFKMEIQYSPETFPCVWKKRINCKSRRLEEWDLLAKLPNKTFHSPPFRSQVRLVSYWFIILHFQELDIISESFEPEGSKQWRDQLCFSSIDFSHGPFLGCFLRQWFLRNAGSSIFILHSRQKYLSYITQTK